jgi:hypothetical protein
LPYILETTDFVRLEVETPEQIRVLDEIVNKGGLTVFPSTVEQLASIRALHDQFPRLSVADCSVIFHALDRFGIILSGDRLLRKEAESKNLEVHGTPWILGLMVEHRLITPIMATKKLETLLKINPRLPHAECAKLIEIWKTLQ